MELEIRTNVAECPFIYLNPGDCFFVRSSEIAMKTERVQAEDGERFITAVSLKTGRFYCFEESALVERANVKLRIS